MRIKHNLSICNSIQNIINARNITFGPIDNNQTLDMVEPVCRDINKQCINRVFKKKPSRIPFNIRASLMIIFDNSAITYYHQAIFTIKQFSCSWCAVRLLLTKSHIQIELVKHLQMISIPIEYILKLAILISECLQQSLLLRTKIHVAVRADVDDDNACIVIEDINEDESSNSPATAATLTPSLPSPTPSRPQTRSQPQPSTSQMRMLLPSRDIDSGKWKCPWDNCNRQFAKQHRYTEHQTTYHHGNRLKCNYCESTFASKNFLESRNLRKEN
ncbi:Strongly-conserved Zn-finger binding protein (TFIIIA) [Dermatophagoides farinae]|uniref:Strongly-conserved Zn-finger binding protein (TFIIIA) n=1 Tax=Dermatophagoides farinae TaxID=6954 RepID=A0A922L1B1_DERFA|nr:Strongly-conserved Zn-finger binding protein (TFIIIA) [Dermatophagoides farinae]